jgi:PKHD-type hydroxylase
MRKIQQTFWKWEASVDATFCDAVIEEYFNKVEKINGAVNKEDNSCNIDLNIRKTTIAWADDKAPIFNTMYQYIADANLNGGWDYDISGLTPVQIAEYVEGCYYDWHSDMDNPCEEGYQRKLSCSVQLSDPDTYEGGDLLLENAQGQQFIAPRQKGSVIVFPSFLKHKVSPITKGIRYSAVGWMRGPAFK